MGISFHIICALLTLSPTGAIAQDASSVRPAIVHPAASQEAKNERSSVREQGRRHGRNEKGERKNSEAKGHGQSSAERRRARLDRWQHLSPEQQAKLRGRFEKLRSLDAKERQDVEDRATHMRHLAENVIQGLSDSERARLQGLEPEQRAKILREMVEAEARHVGRRVHDKLPPEVRKRIDAAPPEDLRRILAELRHRQRDHESSPALERLARHLHIPQTDVEGWKALSSEERMQKLLELGRHAIQRRVEETGPGGGLDRETWQRIRNLPPEEFHAALMRLGHSLMGHGPGEPPPSWARELEPQQIERLRRVFRENERPSTSDWLKVADLPDHERPIELRRRARARALVHIEKEKILPPDKLELLRAMPDRQFNDAVRRLMRAGRGAHAPAHPQAQPRKPGGHGGTPQGRQRSAPDPTHDRKQKPQRPHGQRPPAPKAGAKTGAQPPPKPEVGHGREPGPR
jgi:hypothetical protein